MNRRSLLCSLLGIPLVPIAMLVKSKQAWAGMDLSGSRDCTAIVAYRGHRSIPFIGPELSPEAAARSYAEVANYVPRDTPFVYHLLEGRR